MASSDHSTIEARRASLASLRVSASMTSRVATRMPRPTATMSDRIAVPNSHGDSMPRKTATRLTTRRAPSAAAPPATTIGWRNTLRLTKVKRSAPSGFIVPLMHSLDSGLLYPPADRYVEAFGAAQLGHWLARRNIGGFRSPLSVNYRTFQYTPSVPSQGGSAVGTSPDPDRCLAKEMRLVTALLPESDRAALAAAPDGGGEGDVIAIGPGAF